MYITSPDPIRKTIEFYEFTFRDGLDRTHTIDRASGDTIDLHTYPHAIVIDIVEKPSPIDPKKYFEAEQITIFTQHLLSIRKQVREVDEPTQEQQEQMRLTIQEISKTIQ